jgi:hypothetical protein
MLITCQEWEWAAQTDTKHNTHQIKKKHKCAHTLTISGMEGISNKKNSNNKSTEVQQCHKPNKAN